MSSNFSFSQYGAPQKTAQELSQENESQGSNLMPPQKNNLFVIDKAEIKEAASGAIGMDVQFSCIGEKYNNRKVFNHFNLIKKDGNVNEISQRQIGALAAALGFEGVLDDPTIIAQYGSVPLVADVTIQDGQNGYAPRNQLANWKQNKGQALQVLPMPAKYLEDGGQPAMGAQQPQGSFHQPQQAPQGFGGQPQGFAAPQQQAPSFAQPQQHAPANAQELPAFARSK